LYRPAQSKIVLPYFIDYYLIIHPKTGMQN
jgi:hypothetical protein